MHSVDLHAGLSLDGNPHLWWSVRNKMETRHWQYQGSRAHRWLQALNHNWVHLRRYSSDNASHCLVLLALQDIHGGEVELAACQANRLHSVQLLVHFPNSEHPCDLLAPNYPRVPHRHDQHWPYPGLYIQLRRRERCNHATILPLLAVQSYSQREARRTEEPYGIRGWSWCWSASAIDQSLLRYPLEQ